MAIVQISRITHRKGLKENLPQLDGAEFGWAVDAQELYIGNATIDEGAPAIGNTRILTERDDLLSFAKSYVFKGEEAGYTVQTGPTANLDIERSLQNKLDDIVSVRDFGARGDGVTDDTDAINRAFFEIYCRNADPLVRRTIYFPAGVYRVSDTILIPPYAKINGDGADSSVIQYKSDDSTLAPAVARTCGNGLEVGSNISTAAVAPAYIEIESISFETMEDVSIFLVDRAQHIKFCDVIFKGEKTVNDFSGTITAQTAISFIAGTGSNVSVKDVVIDRCGFYNCNYAIRVLGSNDKVEKVTITNSEFDTLFSGIDLSPTNTSSQFWPEGFRIASNSFDNIFARGINFFRTQYSISVGNIFFDVGNELSTNANPNSAVFPVIEISQSNNISWGDIFKRTAEAAAERVAIADNARVLATENGQRLRLGQLSLESTVDFPISDVAETEELFRLDVTDVGSFNINYRLSFPNSGIRTGILSITKDADGVIPVMNDTYQETGTTRGFTFLVEQQEIVVSSTITDEIIVKVATTAAGTAGNLRYSLSYFD